MYEAFTGGKVEETDENSFKLTEGAAKSVEPRESQGDDWFHLLDPDVGEEVHTHPPSPSDCTPPSTVCSSSKLTLPSSLPSLLCQLPNPLPHLSLATPAPSLLHHLPPNLPLHPPKSAPQPSYPLSTTQFLLPPLLPHSLPHPSPLQSSSPSLPQACDILLAHVDFISKPVVAFIRLAEAIDAGCERHAPVRFMLLIAGPEEQVCVRACVLGRVGSGVAKVLLP